MDEEEAGAKAMALGIVADAAARATQVAAVDNFMAVTRLFLLWNNSKDCRSDIRARANY